MPELIGLCGGSSSGKTTISNYLRCIKITHVKFQWIIILLLISKKIVKRRISTSS